MSSFTLFLMWALLSMTPLRGVSTFGAHAIARRRAQRPVLSYKYRLASSSVSPEKAPKRVPAKFVPFPFSYHQMITITIETLTNRGWGLGRVEIPNMEEAEKCVDVESNADQEATPNPTKKWVVMVPNVLPQEVVQVSIFRNHKAYSEADLVNVIEPSPHRIQPKCDLASSCGGCQLQHSTITFQRDWKRQSVQDDLEQFGILTKVQPTVGTEHIYGYRSKLTPHFQGLSRQQRKEQQKNPNISFPIETIGFQEQTSRTLVDVPHCPIATDAINAQLQTVRAALKSQPRKSHKGATLLLRQDNWNSTYVSQNYQEHLTTNVLDKHFTYQAGNFFQNNYHVLPLMVQHVRAAAGIDSTIRYLVDCYCGSGLFAISCADQFKAVYGIEINNQAIAEATENARRNHVTNCRFQAASAETIFDDIQFLDKSQTAVLVDPPRKGCSEEFLQQVVQFAPKRILYMSCDPTTQARDAAFLLTHYDIASVEPFDLFPQTRHIECFMVLERRELLGKR